MEEWKVMSKLAELRQEQMQKEQQVLEELVTKFDGDQQLLEAFLDEGYSVTEPIEISFN